MTAPDPTAAALELLAAVRKHEAEHARLRAVEQAWAEYAAAVADDQRAADDAAAEVTRLTAALAARAVTRDVDPDMWGGPGGPVNVGTEAPLPPAPPPRVPPPPPDRRAFRRQVNQFRWTWGIDDGLLARLNGIVDAIDRPIGEALALLPEAAFRPASGESVAAHEARLRGWVAALADYGDALTVEVRGLAAQYARREGIWEAWAARGADPGRWNVLVESRSAELRASAAARRAEAERLRAKLGPGGTA